MLLARSVFVLSLLGLQLHAGDPAKPLFDAVRNDDLATLKGALAHGADANARGDRNMTPLMAAAAYGSPEAMRILLAAGADVNATNDFEATALMWGIGEIEKVRLLLDKGADVNAVSKLKSTALLLACERDGTEEAVKLLLARGADLKVTDKPGNNPLTGASLANNTAVVRLLLEKGADVNSRDGFGDTALMNAAGNGNLEMTKMLLAKGADVNAIAAKPFVQVKNGTIQLGEFTPLMLVFTHGTRELVETLLKAGARVNAQESRGMTPLHYAVARESADPALVKLLLAAGADPGIKMVNGETAADWAAKFGNPSLLALLPGVRPAPLRAMTVSALAKPDVRAAAQKSLDLLQTVSASFFEKGGCISCHAQDITAAAVALARRHGLKVDEAAAEQERKMVSLGWFSQRDTLLLRDDPPGGFDSVVFALWELAASGHIADITTDAMLHNLAATQASDGGWHDGSGIVRVPIEDSDFTRTAMALRMLQVFGNPGRRANFDRRIAKARDWLLAAKPVYTEDRDWQLLGLRWAGADAGLLRRLRQDLIAHQRPDGGWAQNAHLPSDAYATGQVLYALHEGGGLAAGDPVYRRGVAWLLGTQAVDGSWHVPSRAPKFQPYFQSGFPYDHDQWISQMGTAWATMALTLAVEPAPEVAAR